MTKCLQSLMSIHLMEIGIKIDEEIITYTSKTDTTFNGCVRGFCGITSYRMKAGD